MRVDEYEFVTSDLLTGDILSQVEIHSGYWDIIFNRPGAGLFTARYDVPTTTPANFKGFGSALWAIKEGVIQWGGIIGKPQRRGNTHVLSVPVIGFFEYFRWRILRNTQGMSFGAIENVTDIAWRAVDQFNIFKDMIDHAQSFTDGSINVGVEWDALSGVTPTLVYPTYAVKYIGLALEELMPRREGFNFRQVYRFENGQPRCNFKLEYPSHSIVVPDALIFQPERVESVTNAIISSFSTDGSSGSDAQAPNHTSVTGDIDIRTSARLDDWTPSTVQTLASKWQPSSNQRSWRLQVTPTGLLRFEWSTTGANVIQEESSTPVSFVAGNIGTVRVTLDVDNGASDYTIRFYESFDHGQTWQELVAGPGTIQGSPVDWEASNITQAFAHQGNVSSVDPFEWVYSLDGGINWIVFDDSLQLRTIVFVEFYFESFNNALDETNDWTVYDGPGHAGNGVRDPNQVTVSFGSLRIQGESDVTDGVRSGGLAHRPKWARTYGRWRTRMSAEADSTFTFSALALLWSRYNTSGPVPGGEIDFVEMTAPNADDRIPVQLFVHGNTNGINDIVTNVQYPGTVDGTVSEEYYMEWTPGRIDVYRHVGPGTFDQVYLGTVIDSPTTPTPKTPMHFAAQLDAFASSYAGSPIEAQYEWVGMADLFREPLLVKARLVALPNVDTPTAEISFTGRANMIQFTTDFPEIATRVASSFIDLTATWNHSGAYQVEEANPGSVNFTDATGPGSSGTGTTTTFGAAVVAADGKQYRVKVTDPDGVDWWSTIATIDVV